MGLILNGWNAVRWIRLSMAAFILAGGIYYSDRASVALGLVFAFMTIFNIGCCGAGTFHDGYCEAQGPAVPPKFKNAKDEDVAGQ